MSATGKGRRMERKEDGRGEGVSVGKAEAVTTGRGSDNGQRLEEGLGEAPGAVA